MTIDNQINEIFASCKSIIARVVSRMVPPHEIEDIVQETYVRVCKFQRKNQISNHRALMLSTARNLAIDYIKRAETRLSTSTEEGWIETLASQESSEDPSYDKVASDEEFALFCEVVRQLPQQCRRVFVLKKVYGFSQREIAEKLELSESTVEKHIAKGMKHCVLHMLQGRDDREEGKSQKRRSGGHVS
ncbi:RNA polymerase sigma factor [Parahaliea mediterranea]|uniref:RNA polymerase sigma factor n=1 Tax=Parahaliea mediterranea TaxID=651086 RepID=UPI000E2F39EF|nr:sigma-70 family RNA polymerase sigma factor [Parahaliea mediterranea]